MLSLRASPAQGCRGWAKAQKRPMVEIPFPNICLCNLVPFGGLAGNWISLCWGEIVGKERGTSLHENYIAEIFGRNQRYGLDL